MKKKKIFLYIFMLILISVCVYCSFQKRPSLNVKIFDDSLQDDKTENVTETSYDAEEMIEAYFKERPVRDIPEGADFSSFLKGTFAKRHQEYTHVADAYEKVLLSDPENQDMQSSLFMYFVLAGRVDKAQIYADRALTNKKNEALAQMVNLVANIKQKNYAKSLKMVDDLGQTYHGFLQPVMRSWLFVAQGKLDDALKAIEAIHTQELEGLYFLHKGAMLDYFNQTSQAAKAYDSLMLHDEFKNVRVLMLLREFETRTQLLSDKKKLNETYALLEDESFVSKEMMSQNQTGERIRTPEAGVSWGLFDIASALVSAGDMKAALFFSQLARHLNPDSSVIQLFVGEVLETMDALSQANNVYYQVQPQQNIYLSSRVRIVLNFIKMKQFDEAEQLMNSLTQQYPNMPLFHMTLGDINRERKQYEQALLNYQKTLDLVSRKDKQVAPIYFYQGVCYDSLNKKKKSIEMFEKALQLDPKNPVYLNYVGYSWIEENRNLKEALQLIEQAVSYAPDDGNLLDSLGYAYYAIQDYDKAVLFLEKAVELESGNAVINSHLGDVYWKLKRYREARFQWAHAKTLKQASSEKLLTELSAKMENGLPK